MKLFHFRQVSLSPHFHLTKYTSSFLYLTDNMQPCSRCWVSCSSCSLSLRSLAAATSSGRLTCNWASEPTWRSRKVRRGPPRANSSSRGRLPQLRCRRAGTTSRRAQKPRKIFQSNGERVTTVSPPWQTRLPGGLKEQE